MSESEGIVKESSETLKGRTKPVIHSLVSETLLLTRKRPLEATISIARHCSEKRIVSSAFQRRVGVDDVY